VGLEALAFTLESSASGSPKAATVDFASEGFPLCAAHIPTQNEKLIIAARTELARRLRHRIFITPISCRFRVVLHFSFCIATHRIVVPPKAVLCDAITFSGSIHLIGKFIRIT
jgi:hypothetical protein